MNAYNPKEIEKKWQDKWEADGLYTAHDDPKRKKFYALVEFPYPSGDGLHTGHPRSFTAMDVISRKRRMEGYSVLYPMGWDAFGLPAENYAIKTGRQPAEITKENIATFKRQIKSLGLSFDWSREVNTTDPKYYKWTQWIFLKMLKAGLAYKAKMPINWCPKCKIGLANEEAVGGVCERCGGPTEKREKEQWMLAITKYAERLHKDLDDVNYLDRIKTQQRNWIGRSEGYEIEFRILPTPALPRREGEIGYHTTETKIWKQLQDRVLEMRSSPTQAEKLLWENLRGNLTGYHFRQQHVIANFIVDFVCLKKNLVVEVDGDIHDYKKDDDAIRTAFLEEQGFTVIRFTNEEVLRDVASVVSRIVSSLNSLPSGEGKGGEESISVFTTRIDTLFGATYVVLAPEHPLVQSLNFENRSEVEKYVHTATKKQEIDRTAESKDKTGVELKGIKAVNPANGEEIPVWVADYVLGHYGTGAVMAVPAHDERDFAFAKKYNLLIKQVVAPEFGEKKGNEERRDGGIGFAFDPKTQKYAAARSTWKFGVFGGGVDSKEDIIEGTTREVIEESGLYDFKHAEKICATFAHYRNTHRNVNRITLSTCILLILETAKTKEVKHEAHEDFVLEWATAEEMHANWNKPEWRDIGVQHWFFEFNNAVGRAIELGYDTTSDPKKFFTSAYTEEGILINSGEFSELTSEESRDKIATKVGAIKKITYKLRDWVFSRQRYWGEPIPVVYCPLDGIVPLDESELPLTLPPVENYQPTDNGDSPLAQIEEWVNTLCPTCGGPAKRETDTMPNWAGSSWYYLRYCDPDNEEQLASPEKLKYWTPIDWYNGGMEHTTLHLLYSRFWHKFLFDEGVVPTSEPYAKRTSQGMILASNGEKMSKSKGNVINPDKIVEQFGADAFRLYELFMGPFDQAIAWNSDSLAGVYRFIERGWNLREKVSNSALSLGEGKGGAELEILLNQTIKKVGEDIEEMKFNTAISSLMILVNKLGEEAQISKETYAKLLQIFAPFAPHVAEELWAEISSKQTSIHSEPWPSFDTSKLEKSTVEIVVQVAGKIRARLSAKRGLNEKEALDMAKSDTLVSKWLENAEIRKVVYIQDKLLNIVV